MIWFDIKEETPLDTMDEASLWLWDGWKVVAGGFDEGFDIEENDWFDVNGISIKEITHWRAIMPWDFETPNPPTSKDLNPKLAPNDIRRRLKTGF